MMREGYQTVLGRPGPANAPGEEPTHGGGARRPQAHLHRVLILIVASLVAAAPATAQPASRGLTGSRVTVQRLASSTKGQPGLFADYLTAGLSNSSEAAPYAPSYHSYYGSISGVSSNQIELWDLEHGTLEWSRFADGKIIEATATHEAVYLLTDHSLTGLDIRSGAPRWQFLLATERFANQPILGDRKISYLRASPANDLYAGSIKPTFTVSPDHRTLLLWANPHHVTLIRPDARTSTELAVPTSIALHSQSATWVRSWWTGSSIFLFDGLLLLRLTPQGTLLWKFRPLLKSRMTVPPDALRELPRDHGLDEGLCFLTQYLHVVSRDGGLIARAKEKLDARHYTTGAGEVLVCDARMGLRSFDTKTGRELWQFAPEPRLSAHLGPFKIAEIPAPITGEPIVAPDSLGRQWIIVAAWDSVYVIGAEGQVRRRLRLMEVPVPKGMSFIYAAMASNLPPFIDGRTLYAVVSIVKGQLDRDLRDAWVDDYLVRVPLDLLF